jgi:hypothetical protein
MFDTLKKGYLSTTDVHNALTKLNVGADREDIALLAKHYGHGISQLSYEDFSKLFLPNDSEYAKMMRRRRSSGRCEFSPDTEAKLRDLFRVHITNETSTERLRQQLNN